MLRSVHCDWSLPRLKQAAGRLTLKSILGMDKLISKMRNRNIAQSVPIHRTTMQKTAMAKRFALLLVSAIAAQISMGVNMPTAEQQKSDKKAFEQASARAWDEIFSDSCTGDWKEKWFLDGEIGTVKTGPDGMTLTAGPEFKNDAHHMVLWTKQAFEGDLKIEYDYTRLDNENRCVTILYIQATGSGKEPYAKDITEWSHLRKVPAMKTYFNNMNAYHISYAAFRNTGEDVHSYIRARRYMPHKSGLKGTDLEPDYFSNTLFATGVKHHITVIKKDRDLYMRIENPDEVYYCHMANLKLPVISEGRIGLRHMFTRSARYENIRVSHGRD